MIKDTEYENLSFPSLESVLSNIKSKDPEYKGFEAEAQLADQSSRLIKSEMLPDLGVGYEIEKTPSEEFRGVSVGISIPLWGNKSRIKQAKAMSKAAMLETLDNQGLYLSQIKSLYTETKNSHESYTRLKKAVEDYQADYLLKKAVMSGEISLIDYYQELEYYYGIEQNFLEAEKEYHQNLAKILKYSY